MRPDPHKQKASRRYQAKHRTAANADTPGAVGQHRQADRAPEIEHDVNSKGIVDTNEDENAREDEEDIGKFLQYLKDESQRVTTEQSAVYFQLRTEADSSELGARNEGMWQELLDVDWDCSLKSLATGATLQELLDTDHEFAPTDEARQGGGDITPREDASSHLAQIRGIARQMDSVELAPNAKPAPKQHSVGPPVAKKQEAAQPVDDLEAILDDLL